jgi:hypothetical protein
MRIFDLFLRRAGVDRAIAVGRRRSVSRLTVEGPRAISHSPRGQFSLDFRAEGLVVSEAEIDSTQNGRRTRNEPDVHHVRYGKVRRNQAV